MLMTWLESTPTRSSWPDRIRESSPETAGSRPIFPMNRKKKTKVASRPKSALKSSGRLTKNRTSTTAASISCQGRSRSTQPMQSRNRSV